MKSNLTRNWIWTAVSGTSGLLFGGVGAMYAPEAIASILGRGTEKEKVDTNQETSVVEEADPMPDTDIPIAEVSDDMSFAEAFNSAREDVGAGGAFYWHGGIYGTYYEDEWNELSDEDKSKFNDLANEKFPEPEDAENAIRPQDVEEMTVDTTETKTGDVEQAGHENQEGDIDFQIVGSTTVDGHYAVEVDVDGDGKADVLYVDADDSKSVTPDDLLVDREGNVVTMDGEVLNDLDDEEKVAVNVEGTEENEVPVVDYETKAEDDEDDQVAIVGYSEYDGHLVTGYDTKGDGMTDTVIIDIDDDGIPSANDIIITDEHNITTIGELEAAEAENSGLIDSDDDSSFYDTDDGVSL